MERRTRFNFGLLAAWVLFGLFGHDPWKPDEAYTFGLVYHVVERGDWVVPTLAGQFVLEQTFNLPVAAMQDERCAPLRILEQLYQRQLA